MSMDSNSGQHGPVTAEIKRGIALSILLAGFLASGCTTISNSDVSKAVTNGAVPHDAWGEPVMASIEPPLVRRADN